MEEDKLRSNMKRKGPRKNVSSVDERWFLFDGWCEEFYHLDVVSLTNDAKKIGELVLNILIRSTHGSPCPPNADCDVIPNASVKLSVEKMPDIERYHNAGNADQSAPNAGEGHSELTGIAGLNHSRDDDRLCGGQLRSNDEQQNVKLVPVKTEDVSDFLESIDIIEASEKTFPPRKRSIMNIKVQICKICNENIPPSNASAHRAMHRGLSLSCPKCEARCWTAALLRRHLREVHGEGRVERVCETCGKTVSSSCAGRIKQRIRQHNERFHATVSYVDCHVCGKRLLESSLSGHVSSVHEGRHRCCCEVCGKTFLHTANLREHRAVHSAQKPFSCQVCGKGFTQRGYLKTHMRFHTGEKPFKCDLCSESFAAKAMYNAHRNSTHHIVKPFSCDKCGATFPSLLSMQRHVIRKHPEG